MQKVRTFLSEYISRHANPWCRALHIIGVPLAPWGAIGLLCFGKFWEAAAALVVGYGLQWIGHRIEGNKMGDWDMLKAVVAWSFRLGRPHSHSHTTHTHAA